ncbi:MAG: hypothetical protein BWX64_02331 [Acidobacteria bacterium ADurb.Bin051]|nr:MAG: hypothetical protein BWX64_02331 [Acidobacteria bacterium ADurb.Bin051]
MAFYQSDIGKRLVSAPIVTEAGQNKTAKFTYNFAGGFVAASDKLELGELPAGAMIVDAVLVPQNLNGNITVGLMSGELGVADAARTVGTELWSAQAVASTPVRLAALTGWTIAIDKDNRRSIGCTFSADIAGAANKNLDLYVTYTMP